jgi:hypothetical protein
MSSLIDFDILAERRENRRASTDSALFRMAAELAESFLPPGYKDYRDRVQRWRDKLHDAGVQLEHERKARNQADQFLADAVRMEEQLRQTELDHPNWKRGAT